MSRFLREKYESLTAYTPGEQPQGREYIKLNTNESPFAPHEKTIRMAQKAAEDVRLYCDPDCRILIEKLAEMYGVEKENLIVTNGSDEVLHFAFMAYCDENTPALFADITYGFYKVFADLEGVPYTEYPLNDDFRVETQDYEKAGGTVFLANPNANTGIEMDQEEIERLLRSDPDRVVVIDEAYHGFGAESCIDFIKKYDNLLVTRTFSKGWAMAGARLGVGIGSREIIDDLGRIRFSTNPYNVNSMTQAAGIGAVEEREYISSSCALIAENREWTRSELEKRGFVMTPSKANFIFAMSDRIGGKELYSRLKEKGVLVRHFSSVRIDDYIRITIGSREQMEVLVKKIDEIMDETGGRI